MLSLTDAVKISGTRRTSDGYLIAEARAVRTGIQDYAGSEVGRPDLPMVRVYRPPAEVFADASLQSFTHAPVTNDHPRENVSARNWKDLAIGEVSTAAKKDGEWVWLPLILKDASAINAVEDGKRELSAGYTCELDWTSGITADGQRYDAIQRGIRINHLALVDKARAGELARIGDGANRKHLHQMTDAEQRAMKDSVKGMPLDQAAALPIYDNVRGMMTSGMPAEKYFAILDGATADTPKISDEQARCDAAYQQMVSDMGSAWRGNESRRDEPQQMARDGRPLAQLSDTERAYEEMIHGQANAWRTA